MKRFYLFGFLMLMLFDTFAQISFKYASMHAEPLMLDTVWLARVFSHPWIYGAFIGYIGAFVTWMTLLKYVPIGPAFAASHLEIISVTLVSIWLFDDSITMWKFLGGAVILLGVLCLAKAESERSSAPESSH